MYLQKSMPAPAAKKLRCLEQMSIVNFVTTAVSGTANGNSPVAIRLIQYFHIF